MMQIVSNTGDVFFLSFELKDSFRSCLSIFDLTESAMTIILCDIEQTDASIFTLHACMYMTNEMVLAESWSRCQLIR